MEAFILNNKNLKNKDLYNLFCQTFPDMKITQAGLDTKRVRLGGAKYQFPHKKTRNCESPLLHEKIKKNTVLIKVQQPNVYVLKARYIWEKEHPEDKVKNTEQILHLDGDYKNNEIENLLKVPTSIMGAFNNIQNKPYNDREQMKILIAKLILHDKILIQGEKIGIVKVFRNKQGKIKVRKLKENKEQK